MTKRCYFRTSRFLPGFALCWCHQQQLRCIAQLGCWTGHVSDCFSLPFSFPLPFSPSSLSTLVVFVLMDGTLLALQWSGLITVTAVGLGSVPGQGTKILQATRHSLCVCVCVCVCARKHGYSNYKTNLITVDKFQI